MLSRTYLKRMNCLRQQEKVLFSDILESQTLFQRPNPKWSCLSWDYYWDHLGKNLFHFDEFSHQTIFFTFISLSVDWWLISIQGLNRLHHQKTYWHHGAQISKFGEGRTPIRRHKFLSYDNEGTFLSYFSSMKIHLNMITLLLRIVWFIVILNLQKNILMIFKFNISIRLNSEWIFQLLMTI